MSGYPDSWGKYFEQELLAKGFWLDDCERIIDYLYQTYQNDQDYNYVDNLRIARSWIDEEIKEYERKRDNGCCGCFEGGVTSGCGRTIRIGFNYGH